jgi:hypothetical protein
MFQKHHPSVSLKLSKFKELAPWYLSQAKQESCLCKACENFTCYEKGLTVALDLLAADMLQGADEEDEVPESERDPIFSDWRFKSLQQLEGMKRRIDKSRHVLCSGSFGI